LLEVKLRRHQEVSGPRRYEVFQERSIGLGSVVANPRKQTLQKNVSAVSGLETSTRSPALTGS